MLPVPAVPRIDDQPDRSPSPPHRSGRIGDPEGPRTGATPRPDEVLELAVGTATPEDLRRSIDRLGTAGRAVRASVDLDAGRAESEAPEARAGREIATVLALLDAGVSDIVGVDPRRLRRIVAIRELMGRGTGQGAAADVGGGR